MSNQVTLLRTYASLPSVLAHDAHGEEVVSGIRKRPVEARTVMVGRESIVGDGQGDLRVHGGPDKAVYCYPSEHLPFWREAVGYEGHGEAWCPMGENLSVAGITEHGVCIGDRWQWGEVILEVSQPRWPCFKLMLTSNNQRIVKRFVQEGDKSGWYLRVVQEGEAPTKAQLTIIHRDPEGITIADAFRANRDRTREPELWSRVCAHPLLADQWKI